MADMCGTGGAGGRPLGGGGAPDHPDQGGAGQALLPPLLRHHHPRPLDPDRAALDDHNRWLQTFMYLKEILSIDMGLFSVHHYPKENLQELSSIFCKIFDPDMSPLAFELEDMYKYGQQPQWLQCLEILTPTLHLDSSLCGWSVPLPSSSARWRSGSRLSATSGSSFRWRCSVLLSPSITYLTLPPARSCSACTARRWAAWRRWMRLGAS